jgi:hypothetical protein
MRLEEACDLLGLTVEIHRRRHPPDAHSWWYAYVRHIEIRDGGILRGVYGDGATPNEALESLATRLSGQPLVWAAGTDKRREFTMPQLEPSR